MLKRFNAEIWAPSPKPPLKVRIWNKSGNWMIGIGLFWPFFKVMTSPFDGGMTVEEFTYLITYSALILLIGLVVRFRSRWLQIIGR
jgi:hypothetical protein